MQGDRSKAHAIAQELLDITGASLLSSNFETFADCFALPTVFDTFDGQVQLDTKQDLRDRFEQVMAYYRSVATTELVRHIVAADLFDERTIHSTHQCRVLSGATLVQAPFTVFSILKNTGARWQITFSQYAVPDADTFNSALTGATSTKGELIND